MNEAIIVAVISGLCTLLGTVYGIRKSNSLTEYKLEELRQEVRKHNGLIDRMYHIEGRADLLEHRIEDVEDKVGA